MPSAVTHARGLAIASLLAAAGTAGASATFQVDEAQSEIRVVSAQLNVLGFTLPGQPTQPGSWDAPLDGEVIADLPAGAIQLLPATSVNAVDDTPYLPGDISDPATPAPGSLAVEFTIPFAGTLTAVTRGLVVSLFDAAPRTIDAPTGQFDALGLTGEVIAGVVDVDNLGTPEQGALAGNPLGGNMAVAAATLIEAGGVQTLTIPLEYTLVVSTPDGTLEVDLEGEIIATRAVPVCVADLNGDGATDVFDFAELANNFGAGPGATLAQGDITGDGFVDVFDFAELANDFGCPH